MKLCTEKQAYYIYKCTERYYCGYKMRKSSLTNLCEHRRNISSSFIELYKESIKLYRKIHNYSTEHYFYLNDDNKLSFYEAFNFIKKSKKIEDTLHMVKCKECEYYKSCEAFKNGKIKII